MVVMMETEREAASESFQNLTKQVNKLMDQMHRGYYNYHAAETWIPNVNLYENDTAYLVCVDLAGVDKEKIDVELVDQHLRLRGTRVVPTPPADLPAAAATDPSPPPGEEPDAASAPR